jgi:hypothetical protein
MCCATASQDQKIRHEDTKGTKKSGKEVRDVNGKPWLWLHLLFICGKQMKILLDPLFFVTFVPSWWIF